MNSVRLGRLRDSTSAIISAERMAVAASKVFVRIRDGAETARGPDVSHRVRCANVDQIEGSASSSAVGMSPDS